MEENIFDEKNVVDPQSFEFNVVGDNIYGTLIRVKEFESKDRAGEMVKMYELKAEGGEFHQLSPDNAPIEPAIKIVAGEEWNIYGHWSIDDAMKKVRLGQKIGIKFTETQPSKNKMHSAKKIKKLFLRKDEDGQPLMDKEWIEANTLGDSEE